MCPNDVDTQKLFVVTSLSMSKNIVYFSGGLSSQPSDVYIPIFISPFVVSISID